MVDIETLDNKPTSSITSIAGVAFDIDGNTGPEFMVHVDLQDCINKGLTVSADTLLWWLGQDEAARGKLIEGQQNKPYSLDHALFELRAFIESLQPATLQIWGNSARFDLGILHNAYLHTKNKNLPWKHSMERDVRTISAMFPEIKKAWVESFKGTKHDPIDDCKNQIGYLTEMLRQIYFEA